MAPPEGAATRPAQAEPTKDEFAPGAGGLKRLTDSEFRNSVRDLLGDVAIGELERRIAGSTGSQKWEALSSPSLPTVDRSARGGGKRKLVVDASEMSGLLGARDRQRLEQHLSGIRQLESRLTASRQCSAPPNPAASGITRDTRSEAPKVVNDTMSDLLALAFACDLTRAASMVFTLPAAHAHYRHLGADMNDDFHDTICHTAPGDSSSQTRVHRGKILFTMANSMGANVTTLGAREGSVESGLSGST
jgi:hypothetical protein